METLKLSKDHWTFKLISLIYDRYDYEWEINANRYDTCIHKKQLFWSSFWLAVISALAFMSVYSASFFLVLCGIVAFNTAVPWYSLVSFTMDIVNSSGNSFEKLSALWGFVAVFLPAVLFGMWVAIVAGTYLLKLRPTYQAPTKTQELFRTWKEKYCKKIEFE